MHEGIENFTMPSDEQARVAADALRMLADPTRLKLMWALLQGEKNVACLAGLVTTRREGTFVYYSAAGHHIEPLLEQVLSHAAKVTGTPSPADSGR